MGMMLPKKKRKQSCWREKKIRPVIRKATGDENTVQPGKAQNKPGSQDGKPCCVLASDNEASNCYFMEIDRRRFG